MLGLGYRREPGDDLIEVFCFRNRIRLARPRTHQRTRNEQADSLQFSWQKTEMRSVLRNPSERAGARDRRVAALGGDFRWDGQAQPCGDLREVALLNP